MSAALPKTDAELRAWLRLMLTPGVGNHTARALLAQLGPPETIFASTHAQHLGVVNERVAQALAQEPQGLEDAYAQTQHWLSEADHRALITLDDAHYPPACWNQPTRRCGCSHKGSWRVCAKPMPWRLWAVATPHPKAWPTREPLPLRWPKPSSQWSQAWP